MPSDAYEDVDILLPQSDRLQTLSPEEYELLWGWPYFSRSDSDLFFELSPREEAILQRLRTCPIALVTAEAVMRSRQWQHRTDNIA